MLNKIIPFLVLLLITVSLISQENPFYAPGNPDSYVQQYPLHSYLDTNLIVNGIWSRLNNLPKALVGVNAYYYQATNKIFICGGADANAVPNDTCWWYDIAGGSYQLAPFLPGGRWLGKLVRVKDNLYLVGSIDSTFSTADGIIYKYSLLQNEWSIADTMPAPLIHEAAVCVLNDSLIYLIGGSTTGYSGAGNIVRIYNPLLNTWQSTNPFPVNITMSHAEINVTETDTSIFVVGGYNAGNLNTVFRGRINAQTPDSTAVTWSLFGNSPFNQGVYRVAGARWKDYMLFGPAMSVSTSINSIWGLTFLNDSAVWTSFSPVSGDTIGNISSFATVTNLDSNYFYLFGGFKNPNILNTAQKYSFNSPPPIGIISSNSIPHKFRLYQNYPNPFNPVTRIKFEVPENVNDNMMISIYDVLGREISILINDRLQPGVYEAIWNAEGLPSGIYFCRLMAGNYRIFRKMVVVK